MLKQTKHYCACGSSYLFLKGLTFFFALLPFAASAFNVSFALSSSSVELNCTHFGKNNQLTPITNLPALNYQIKTIIIDPGHGGHDKGCSGAHSQEKHIALGISKKLGAAIQGQYPNINVIYTRTTDVFVPLHERAKLANRHQADLFISVHCNYISVEKVHGSETYVLGLHRAKDNLNVAKRENAAIYLEDNYQKNYDYDPDSPAGHIMLSMFQGAHLEQSISFAEKVEHQFAHYGGRKSRGVKQAGFLVLRETTMPSVLIEAGFLSNSREETYLRSAKGQQYLANAIFRAFTKYKNEVEQGSNTAPSVYNTAPIATYQSPVTKIQVAQRQIVTPDNQQYSNQNYTPKNGIVMPANVTTPTVSTAPKSTLEILAANGYATTNATNTRAAPSLTTRPTFAVQLAASPQQIDVSAGRWLSVSSSIETVLESNHYKYQVRNFNTFNEAEEVRQYLSTRGFSDCFVVAYQSGERINVQVAKALTKH